MLALRLHHAVAADVKDDEWLCPKQVSIAKNAKQLVGKSATAAQSDVDCTYKINRQAAR